MGAAQAEDEGLAPTKEWVKDLIDEIIAEEFASPDLELHWLDEDADPKATEAALEGRLKLGALTLNEMRSALGLVRECFATPGAQWAIDTTFMICASATVDSRTSLEGVPMSMELWVFSDRQLNSIAEWQAAIDAERYPLRLAPDKAFANLRGFFPMRLRGEFTGFECYHDDAVEFTRANPCVDFGRAWKFALGLRWTGSRVDELRAAWMAATAYAQATDGVIVDDQELKIHAPADARAVVRDVEKGLV